MAEEAIRLAKLVAYPDIAKEYVGEELAYLPGFTVVYAVGFFLAYLFWIGFGVPGNGKKALLSSCCISIVHGLSTTYLAGKVLYASWPLVLDGVNTPEQDIIMQWSTAYMLNDLFLYMVPVTPTDILFIGHHIMTIGYMISCVHLGRGGLSCLWLMFLGETTSVFQNMWYIGKELRQQSKVANAFYRFISPPYTIFYILIRSIIAPPAVAWLVYELALTKKLPLGAQVTYMVFAILGTLGSQVWSFKLWRGFKKQYFGPAKPVKKVQ